uniref:Uncharacterized protein n=1 Tax=Arundo donax TaxID=35708 RepID=A0A0A9E7F0_ARUDO
MISAHSLDCFLLSFIGSCSMQLYRKAIINIF